MASIDPRLEAYNLDPFASGLDLLRCKVGVDLGVYSAYTNASFYQGQIAAQNTSGEMLLCDGTGAFPVNVPFGVFRWNKSTGLLAVVQDEQVVMTGVAAHELNHSNILANAIRVTSGPSSAEGVVYTEGVDYTANDVNGTVTRIALGAIADGQTVYVDYTYTPTAAELNARGRNFQNLFDDVSIAEDKVTVITDWSLVFTTYYNSSRGFVVAENLYCDGGNFAGYFTDNSAASRPYVGRVFQIPTATDPFLGVITPGIAPAPYVP